MSKKIQENNQKYITTKEYNDYLANTNNEYDSYDEMISYHDNKNTSINNIEGNKEAFDKHLKKNNIEELYDKEGLEDKKESNEKRLDNLEDLIKDLENQENKTKSDIGKLVKKINEKLSDANSDYQIPNSENIDFDKLRDEIHLILDNEKKDTIISLMFKLNQKDDILNDKVKPDLKKAEDNRKKMENYKDGLEKLLDEGSEYTFDELINILNNKTYGRKEIDDNIEYAFSDVGKVLKKDEIPETFKEGEEIDDNIEYAFSDVGKVLNKDEISETFKEGEEIDEDIKYTFGEIKDDDGNKKRLSKDEIIEELRKKREIDLMKDFENNTEATITSLNSIESAAKNFARSFGFDFDFGFSTNSVNKEKIDLSNFIKEENSLNMDELTYYINQVSSFGTSHLTGVSGFVSTAKDLSSFGDGFSSFSEGASSLIGAGKTAFEFANFMRHKMKYLTMGEKAKLYIVGPMSLSAFGKEEFSPTIKRVGSDGKLKEHKSPYDDNDGITFHNPFFKGGDLKEAEERIRQAAHEVKRRESHVEQVKNQYGTKAPEYKKVTGHLRRRRNQLNSAENFLRKLKDDQKIGWDEMLELSKKWRRNWTLGYIYVYPVHQDEAHTPFKIPFEFNPKITGGGIEAEYSAKNMLHRTGSVQSYVNSKIEPISIETEYMITSNDITDPNHESNDDWLTIFTPNYVQKIKMALRSIALPQIIEEGDRSTFYKPPIVKIVMGDPNEDKPNNKIFPFLTMPSGTSPENIKAIHKTFLVTNVSIEDDVENSPYILDEKGIINSVRFKVKIDLIQIDPNYVGVMPSYSDYFYMMKRDGKLIEQGNEQQNTYLRGGYMPVGYSYSPQGNYKNRQIFRDTYSDVE